MRGIPAISNRKTAQIGPVTACIEDVSVAILDACVGVGWQGNYLQATGQIQNLNLEVASRGE